MEEVKCSAIQVLRSKAWHYLAHDALETAAFTAERALALNSSSSPSRYLIASVYYRLGRFETAMDYALNVKHLGCQYIYAKCCLKLKMYDLGIAALPFETTSTAHATNFTSSKKGAREGLPSLALVYCLLGDLFRASSKEKKAALYYGLAIKIDPLCWEAISHLCEMRVTINAVKLYKDLRGKMEIDNIDKTGSAPLRPKHKGNEQHEVVSQDKHQDKHQDKRFAFGNSNVFTASPELKGTEYHLRRSMRLAPRTQSPVLTTSNSPDVKGKAHLFESLMQSHSPGSVYTPSKSQPRHSNGKQLTTLRDDGEKGQKTASTAVEEFIGDIYLAMTQTYQHFCNYECDAALKVLGSLSPEQQNTPWVVSKQARMQFEKVNYTESARLFQKLRVLDRYRQEDMEYYSTLLWHLQDGPELAYLAHELIAIGRNSAQAWCAVGNALSLSKDTDNAMKCFQRAGSLDPSNPYPFTLQAHEYVASDAYENAQNCYRMALYADKRHYNAWYGLGMVYLRLGNNAMAELHFRKAHGINPVNVVLLCCIGMVLEKMGRYEEGLSMYTSAHTYQPNSALSLYKRARLLLKMGLYSRALKDLQAVVVMTPDEASVHFLLGQIYKALDDRALAVKEFTVALNLDPKGSHLIKEALEGLYKKSESNSVASKRPLLRGAPTSAA